MNRSLFESRGGRVEEVSCPGGATLFLRTLTTKEFFQYQSRLPARQEAQEIENDDQDETIDVGERIASYVEILSYALCDPDTLESLGKDEVDQLPYPLLVILAEKAFSLQTIPENVVAAQKKDSGPTLATVSSSG